MSPNRKPSRMPCLTHVLTRHPHALAGSGSAARTVPADNASRRRANAARAASRSAEAPAATSASMSACRVMEDAREPSDERGLEQVQLLQHFENLLFRLRARRA